MDIPRARALTGLAAADVPELLVVEGSWWRREREAQRLALLEDVRELPCPDWWWGRWRGRPVGYACLYGSPRAVEPVDVLGTLGTPTVVQIGSCGGLDPALRPGDVMLPAPAVVGEGASRWYGGGPTAEPDAELVEAARAAWGARGVPVHTGQHLTVDALFAEPDGGHAAWWAEGHRAVDMETSAVLTVARRRGMRAVAMLYVWDELLAGRGWDDPLPPDTDARRRATEAALFDVALGLALS